MFVGSSSRLPLTLLNTSPVAATLMCDLTASPDFQLLCPKDAWSTDEYESCPLEAIGATGATALGSKFGSGRGSGRNSGGGSRRQSSSLGFRGLRKFGHTSNTEPARPLLPRQHPTCVEG